MSRSQTVLVLTLIALVSLLAGQAMWATLAPAASASLAVLATVPEWAWHTVGWTALSAIWWLPCALGKRSCASRACAPTPA